MSRKVGNFLYDMQTVILLVMFVEAFVILFRHQSHFRITRAFRPIFLIDSPYCTGIRR